MSTVTRNPFREREQLLADVRRAREASDTLRAEVVRLQAEQKQADAEAFKAEMEALLDAEGATEQRDAAAERAHIAEAAIHEKQRGIDAAYQVVQVRQAELKSLYDECFEDFAREAEAATAGAATDLQEAAAAVAQASRSWAKASGLWGQVNAALRHRLEAQDASEGRIGNVAGEAVVPPFPVTLPNDLTRLAPRPRGMNRLHRPDQP